jgi:hypothetical protein
MAEGSKAKRLKPKPKRADKLSQQEQSERFIQTARELEADESGAAFEKAVSVVVTRRSKAAP